MWKRKYEHNKATLAAYPSANNIQAVYHCLQVTTVHGAAPSYLTAMCVPVAASTGRRCLRTAARGDLMVPRTSTITYVSRSFAVSGARVWNDLPQTLRASSTTLRQIKDNTIPLGLRDVTLALSWLFRPLELAPYKCSNIRITYLLTYHKIL